MTAAWRSTVPQDVLKGSYNEEPDDNVLRYETELKPGKARRRSTAKIVNFTFDTVMTDAELAEFIDMHENDFADGSLPFTRLHPRTGESGTFMYADKYSIREHAGSRNNLETGMSWIVSHSMMKLP